MFKMKKRSYRVFEGLRVATLVSYIGGFIDAYTYNTQDERFASIQTGNLLYLVIHLIEGNIARAFSYAIPIFFFILGQFFVFFVKKWLINHKWRWHLQAIRLALLLMTILAIITPYVDSIITIAGLAFFASLQVGIFKRVRGVNYASFMMTGNITNTSLTVARAIDESDPKVLKQASYTIIIIFTFMVGVAASTWFAQYLHEYSLYTTLLPLFILNYFLFIEAKEKRN